MVTEVFMDSKGARPTGNPMVYPPCSPRQSMQQGIRSSLQWQNGLCRLNTNNFRSPFHKCQKAEKIDRCQNQWDGPQAKPVFLQLILSQCLGPHSNLVRPCAIPLCMNLDMQVNGHS
mmetsp:Transcript_25400/g.55508  ORF Transcript_25400/g.55508 Transcript_25400/m.55508 type:complete len:117 (+) Transcript_25400:223-573(+)